MTRAIIPAGSPATGAVDKAFGEVRASFDRFCLAAARHDDESGCDGGLRAAPRSRRAHLEGLDEILTVVRLKLPKELRRSLACTNIAENMMGTIRRVTRNVKR